MNHSLQPFQRWIDQHNHLDLTDYTPFVIDGITYGAVHKKRQASFQSHPDVFVFTPKGITLNSQLDTPALRTEAVAQVVQSWREHGWVRGWRGEPYRVSNSFNAPPVMDIERATASTFGVIRYGIHVNGLVWKDEKLHIWIARRADDKPEFPGMLDHVVAGGIPAGYTAAQVVNKECDEEAAIPLELASSARPVSLLTYAFTSGSSLKRSQIFIYDLVMPEDFMPHNNDGEVAGFELLPIKDVYALVRDTNEFKSNCNLVLIDLFARYGYLSPDQTGYAALMQGLRTSLEL